MPHEFLQTADGLDVYVESAGRNRHPPMVLLHGYPSNHRLWRRCIPDLAVRYRVWAPDLPGHGASGKPPEARYDLSYLTEFLKNLFDALGIARGVLVAHDVGGMAALGFAARHPERLSHLVVMDTTPYPEWPRVLKVMVARARHPLWSRWFLLRPVFRSILRTWLVADPALITPQVVEGYRQPWVRDAAGRQAFRRVIGAAPEELALPLAELRRIATPTLVLWAARDRIIPPDIGRRLAGDLPDARFSLVPDCGHFLPEEQPEAIVRQIINFVEGTPHDM